MARTARLLVPGMAHHIVQRGHDRNVVFAAEQDYRYYLATLRDYKQEYGIQVFAYCLMTNHVHLLLEPCEGIAGMSGLMKRLAGRQTRYRNRLEGRSGTLWEGRYKVSVVQDERYLLACTRYIELNPVRAGMVEGAGQYAWSSYRERMSAKHDLLDSSPVYLALGPDPAARARVYEGLMQQGSSQAELKLIRAAIQRNQLTGDGRFVDQIEQITGRRVEHRGRGRPANQAKENDNETKK